MLLQVEAFKRAKTPSLSYQLDVGNQLYMVYYHFCLAWQLLNAIKHNLHLFFLRTNTKQSDK